MATSPEDIRRQLEEEERPQELELPTTVIRGMWTPASGRDPTPEEMRAYYLADEEEEAPEPVPRPETKLEEEREAPVVEAFRRGEEPWTPESDRDPTPDEMRAYYGITEEPEVVPEGYEEIPVTPTGIRATPGMGYVPPEPVAEEVPPVPEIVPWGGPDSGVDPTVEQMRLYYGLDPNEGPALATVSAVEVNPMNLPFGAVGEDEDIGRIRTYLSNIPRGVSGVISGIPKGIQLWFAPDADIIDWMDRMDVLDTLVEGTTSKAALEIYRKQRRDHIIQGQQDFGTVVNIFTAPLLDAYVETKDNTGETLKKNREWARKTLKRELQTTIERPLYRVGEAMDEIVKSIFKVNPEYAHDNIGQIFEGIGSFGGYALAWMTGSRVLPFGKGKVGGGLTTASVGIPVQQSAMFEEALMAGASIEDAFKAGLSGEAVASGAVEALPIWGFLTRADKLANGNIKRALIRMLTQGTQEALEEGTQQILANLAAQRLYDPERQLWTGTPGAAGIGFSTGAIIEALGSLFPGRRRALARRYAEAHDVPSLRDRMEAAAETVRAMGGDDLDMVESAGLVAQEGAAAEAAQQERVKQLLELRREMREDRIEPDRPLAELADAEAALARLPFEERSLAVAAASAEDIAAHKEAAFAAREAELAEVREEEAREAEYQRELQIGEERERVAEAVERQEVEPARIEEVVEPEVRKGLERMRIARAEREGEAKEYTVADPIGATGPETVRLITRPDGTAVIVRDEGVIDVTNMYEAGYSPERIIAQSIAEDTSGATVTEVVEEPAPAPVKALPAPPVRVTPEGEALLPAEAAAREEELAAERAARAEAAPVGRIERPFVVDEAGREVQAPEVAARGAQLTEQLELPVDSVTAAAQEAATSPTNDLVVTRKQLETGNYKKGRLTPNQTAIPGVDVAIESPAGSVRTGPDWTQDMFDHYGYISRTESAEGPDEQLDVFVNPKIMEQEYDTVFIVDQVNDDGSFDEHKVMMGYQNQMEAVRAYKRNNPRGRKVGTITAMSKIEFRRWLETGDQTTAVAEQPTEPEVLAGEEEFREIAERRQRGRGRRRERKPVIRFRAGEEPTPVAKPYSRMRDVLAQKLPGKMPVAQLPSFIKNLIAKGDFRAEEAAFYDLEEAVEWMEGEGTVTRESILDLMDFLAPVIEEQVLQLGEENEYDTEAEAMAAVEDKYGPLKTRTSKSGAITTLYNFEGKLVATMYGPTPEQLAGELVPDIPVEGLPVPRKNYLVTFHTIDDAVAARHEGFQVIEGGDKYREILITLPRQAGRFGGRFRHYHFPYHDNVLAFARVAIMELEDGRKVFMVLEAQSDWHRIGRKAGYISRAERLAEDRQKAYDTVDSFPQSGNEWLDEVLGDPLEDDEKDPVDWAPYEKTWPLMVMRRMISRAVAEGADIIAWPRGESIAEMYDERMNVKEIAYHPDSNELVVTNEEGRIILEEEMDIENVETVIGKELGQRLKKKFDKQQNIRAQYQMSEEFDEEHGGYPVIDPDGNVVTDFNGDPFVITQPEHMRDVFIFAEDLPGTGAITLEEADLKFGGEKLVKFYNKEMPQKISKWIKRFGTKVRDDYRVMEYGKPVQVFGFEVTTDMQAEAMVRGFPRFRADDAAPEADVRIVEVKDAKKAIKPLTDELVRIKPTVLAEPADAPAEVYQAMRQRRQLHAKGVYYNGKLFIFANNHSDVRDVVRTLLHEGVAHQGLRALYQNEAELNDLLDEVYASMTEEQKESLRARAAAYRELDLDTPAGRRELAEEHIAHLAETDPQNNFIQRIVAKIRQMLREAGMTLEWTNDDIVKLISDARRELREFVPLERITVTTDTGDRRADIALRQLDKRVGVIEMLRECL